MTLMEAIGVKCDVDVKTGRKLEHREVYQRAIEYLGGLNEVAKYVPFSIDELRVKMKKDALFNQSRDRLLWDMASGFTITRKHEAIPNGDGLWHLYRQHGINSASNSQGVCILKEAARELLEQAEKEKNQ